MRDRWIDVAVNYFGDLVCRRTKSPGGKPVADVMNTSVAAVFDI